MSKHSCVEFSKYEGAGNDFILIDDRLLSFSLCNPRVIQQLCHRKFGIGADGIILLQPSLTAHFRMRIFNSDGSEAESCGNGLRCLGQFLIDLGLPQQPYRIELIHRTVEIAYTEDGVKIDMGTATDVRLHQRVEGYLLHTVNTGVPHAVLFVDNIDCAPLETVAPFLRRHLFFQPQGTNVNFATLLPDGSIRIRTYERGVEAETLACGTGACAVAAIAKSLYNLKNPLLIRCTGGNLHISIAEERLVMAGPARRVFQGFFESRISLF